MYKKIYHLLVYFPFMFFGTYSFLLISWLLKYNRLPNQSDEAGILDIEWLITITIYLWFLSIFLGIISWFLFFYKTFYLKEKESKIIVFANFISVAFIILMYIFNIGNSLTWLFG